MIKSNLKAVSFIFIFIFIIENSIVTSKKAFAQNEQIKITNPFINVIGKNAKSAAGYMVLENLSGQKITLLEAVSDFGFTMLHTSEEKDGVVSMIHLDQIDIDKGDKVNFIPGGLHIMFVGIDRDLRVDSTKDILLKFRNSEKTFTKTVSFAVKAK